MIKTEILSVRSPQWVNENRTAVNCLVRTNTLRQEVPFTATPYGSEAHGREIYARCLVGEFGQIAPMGPKPSQQSLSQLKLPEKYQRLQTFLLEANRENSRKSLRSVVIVWSSFLDNLLEEMLEAEALRALAAGKRVGKPSRNFNDRINRAFNAGFIDQEEADRCHHIRKIRNAAAHEWKLSLATEGVLSSLRALYDMDHSQWLVFHEDLEFLLQQVYSSSCAMLIMKFQE